MSILKTAIATNRWDLAAYTLVLAVLRTLSPDAFKTGELDGEPDERKKSENRGHTIDLVRKGKVC